MNTVRCSICRQQLPTLKLLQKHLIAGHSKAQVIKQLLQYNVLNSSPNNILQKYHNKHKTKQLNNIHSEVVFSADETSCESKENHFKPLKHKNIQINTKVKNHNLKINNIRTMYKKLLNNNGVRKSKNVKMSIKRKKIKAMSQEETSCDINEANLNTFQKEKTSLNYKTGQFYKCNCMEKDDEDVCFVKSYDLNYLGSDTEASSDNGKNFLLLDKRICCNTCGNSYSTKEKLMRHLKMHRIQCKVCYRMFTAPHLFREHIKQHLLKIFACYICNKEFITKNNLIEHLNLHFENETLENILDMEQIYTTDNSCTIYYNYCYDYYKKINYIVSYLSQNNPYYFMQDNYNNLHTNSHIYNCNNNEMFMKTICDFCCSELYVYEYDNHLKTFHQF